MWKPNLAVAAVLLVIVTSASGMVALPNESPLADAGLDQEVSKGATVLLDGTGSRDPDGSIETYRWTIRTPSNETTTPDCPTCKRTSFEPTETGRYNVSLTVTDGDGATSTDTLYVDVAPGEAPAVSLSGPQEPTEGDEESYTANFDPGTAGLDYVSWSIDGTEIANHTLSSDQQTDTAEKHFPTAGARTLTATVYDADGQTDTSSLSVTVQSEPDVPNSPSPQPSPGGGSSTSIADRNDPTVDGDAVVTGTEPLRGEYDVRLDASTDNVDSVEWYTSAGRIDETRSLTRTWNPGDHDLYAVVTYSDDSENVATFDDGSTTVVADPNPNVSVESLDRFGSISGTVAGLDEYENLETLRVEVDGEVVATAQSSLHGRYGANPDHKRTLPFSHADFTPGERYEVTVVATDERGQTTKTSTDIVPVKQPEIVRSEFVNDPVDSYHPRIDSDRYAARHVLEIDLNGVDPEDVIIDKNIGSTDLEELGGEEYQRIRDSNEGTLKISTFWRGEVPKEYELKSSYGLNGYQSGWKGEKESTFEVTPSKPELRLDIVNDGTEDYITKEHGILVNASGSFDPDNTEIKYLWKYGASPTKPDNTTAKFWAYERAASIVEDEYDLRTKRDFNFLNYFIPEVNGFEVLTSGPYYPEDTIYLRVETDAYHFSKPTYYESFDLGISTSSSGAEIIDWKQVDAPDSDHSGPGEDAYRYAGIVEISASEFASTSSDSGVTVYNTENEEKQSTLDFPDLNVLKKDGSYWSNVSLRNLEYLIEKPEIDEVTTNSKAERDEYRNRGYSVDEEHQQTEYVLEKRTKVQDARYEVETREFDSEQLRDIFVSTRPDWYLSGTNRKEVTRTKTDTEWRDTSVAENPEWGDSSLWNGEFTGKTRQKLVQPAEYQTQKKYEYEYEVEKTGTKEVTHTETISVPHTGTRTTTECIIGVGCYETTETYTYYEPETRSYTTTETYTYTVTRTKTYWSASKLGWDHEFTGQTKRVKVKDAVYKTQYEIKQKSQYTKLVTVYKAAHDTLVQPAKYEWQQAQTTEEALLARQKANSNTDWRIGESNTDTTWVLSNQTGVVQFETSVYADEDNVVETSVTAEGDVVQRYINEETGAVEKRVTEETEEFTYSGGKERGEILTDLEESSGERRWCKINPDC